MRDFTISVECIGVVRQLGQRVPGGNSLHYFVLAVLSILAFLLTSTLVLMLEDQRLTQGIFPVELYLSSGA